MTRKPQFLALIRHGESDSNVAVADKEAIYYSRAGSDTSVGLTQQGILDAQMVGGVIANLFPPSCPVDRIFVNEFRRIEQSADEIEKKLGYKPVRVSDPRLRKRSYGQFWNVSYKGVELLFPDEHAKYKQVGPLLYRPPGGENYPDVFGRVEGFINEVVLPSQDNMLIVAHSVVMLAFRRHFEQLPDQEVYEQYEKMALPNGCVFLYVRDEPSGSWKRVYPSF